MTTTSCSAALRDAILGHLRADGPAGTTALMAALGERRRRNVTQALRVLREEGRTHICGWERTASDLRPLYAHGPGADAPQPRRYTPAERNALYRARHAGESREDQLIRLACRTPTNHEAAMRFSPWANMIRDLT